MRYDGKKGRNIELEATESSAVQGPAWGRKPGQARPGHIDGFIAALAQLAFLKSQSQAVRPRLFNTIINQKNREIKL